MRHVPEGTLRRLLDEPVTVPDREVEHLTRCDRCRRHAQRVADDAAAATALLAVPPAEPQIEVWPSRVGGSAVALRGLPKHRRWQLMWPSLGSGATIAAIGSLVVAGAAAATLTTVFAPTRVTPVPVSAGELQPIAQLLGFSSRADLAGFAQPSGTRTLPFGRLAWSSSGAPEAVTSLAAAESATGLSVVLPASLPNGVGAPTRYTVLRAVTATISFDASAGATLSGSTLEVTVGPGVAVLYGASSSPRGTTMGIASLTRPLVTASGASASELESFVLSRPGVPPALAAALRQLIGPPSALPVPVPPGANSNVVDIDGARGVELSDPTGSVSAAVWEDADGQVHLVGGLLDPTDTLDVARQVG